MPLSGAMTSFSGEQVFEKMMVAGSLFLLLGAAAVLDDRVRDRATGVIAGSAMSELAAVGEQVQRAVQQAADTVGYQSNENGTLVFFVVAAAILFFVMLKT